MCLHVFSIMYIHKNTPNLAYACKEDHVLSRHHFCAESDWPADVNF